MSTRDFLFQNAIHSGDLETIKRIYEEGGSNLIDLPSDINCCTPLMTASQNGRLDIVKYLVSLGASTNVQDRGGYTALMHGVVGGELDVVTYLVQQTVFPCDLLKLNNDNDCALDIARDQGFSEIEDLLASELNRFLSDPDAIAALSAKQEEEDAKRLELEKINELDPNLNGIYLICAKGLLPNLKEYPVEELAVPNDDGLTPLMVATRHGKFVVLAYMIELKVPLDDRDNTGRTALMHAVERGHRRITQYLLIHGANLYDVNEESTMWDYATDSKHLHILDILDDWKLRFPPGENKIEQAPQSPNKNIAWNENANKIHEFEQDEDEDEEGGEEEADEEEEDEEEEEEEGTSSSASADPIESPSLKVAAASPLIPTVAGRSRVSLSVPAHLANKRLAATAALNSSENSEKEEIEEAVTPLVSSSSTVSSSASSEKKDTTPQPTQKKTQEQPSKPIVETTPEITELPTFTSIDSPKPLEVKELTLEEFEAVESDAISAHEASATSISLNSTKPETPPPQPQPSPPNSSSTSTSQPFRSGTTRGTSLPIPGNTGSTASTTTGPFPLVKSPSAGLPLPSTPMRTTGGTSNTTTPTSPTPTPTSTSGTTPTPSVSSRISAAKLAFDQPTPSPTSGVSPNNPRSRVSMSVPASYIAKRAAKQQEVSLKAPDFEAPQPSPTHVKGKLSLSASAAMRQKILATKHQPDPTKHQPDPTKHQPDPPSPNEATTLPMKQTPVISPVIPSKSITASAPTKTPLPFNPGPPPPDEDSDDDIIPLPATARTPSKSFSTSTSTSKNTTPLPPPSSNPPTNITSRSRISFVSPTKKAPPPPEPEIDEFLPPPPRPADDDDDIGPPPPNHEPPPEPYLPPPSFAPPSRSSSKKKSISSRQSMSSGSSSGSSSRKRLPIPDESDMPPPPPPPEDEDDVPPPPPPPAQNGDDDPSPKKRSRFKSPPPGNRKKNRTKSDRTTKPKKITPIFDTTTTTTTNSSSPFNLPELKVEDTKLDGKIETIPTKKSNSKKGKKKKEKKPKNEKELEKQRKKEEIRLKIEQAKSVKVAEKQEKLKRKQQEKLEKEKKKNSKNSPSSPTYTEMQTEVMPVNDDDPIMVTRSTSTRKSISQFFTSLGRRSSAISPPPKSADASAKKRSQSFSRLFTKSNS